MKFFYFLPILMALVVATPVPAPSAADVYPSSFQVRSITYGGNGCPQGSLDVSVASNGTVLGLTFGRNFVAKIGPNVSLTQMRQFCQLNFDILYDAGFQFQVFSADFHGYVKLDSTTTATVESLYYYSGSTDEVRHLSRDHEAFIADSRYSKDPPLKLMAPLRVLSPRVPTSSSHCGQTAAPRQC
jgi:hypothetical protein